MDSQYHTRERLTTSSAGLPPVLAETRPGGVSAVIAVLALVGTVSSFMQTLLIPIQAQLPTLLGASPDATAWVITVTLLVSTICTPIAGRLGDMYGKRRVLLALVGLLIVGSVIAALSRGLLPLLIGRGLQGASMGVVPLGLALLRDTVPPHRLGPAIALVSATMGVGGAAGMPLSAFVADHADWHALFWIAAALGVCCAVLVLVCVPESPVRQPGRFDLLGAAGLSAGLTGVLLAVSRGHEWGWTAPITGGLFGGGAALLVLWGWYELRRTDPLVDLRVSSRAPVLLTNIASVAMGFALFASSVAFPQLLQAPAEAGGPGLSLMAASLVVMPSGLMMLVVSPVSGWLERRHGPKPLLVTGAAVIALAYLAASVGLLSTWQVLVINIVAGTGVGLGYAAMPALIMRAVPASQTGAANGLNAVMRALGTTTAAAVIAAILANSSLEADGVWVPSASGFRLAFVCGLVAAVASCACAAAIPEVRRPPSA